MKSALSDFSKNHPNISWIIAALVSTYFCSAPFIFLSKKAVPSVIKKLCTIISVIIFIVNVIMCVKARITEKKNGNPNAYMRFVYSVYGNISNLITHPILTVKEGWREIKNADMSGKIKIIIAFIVAVICICYAAALAIGIFIYAVISLIVGSFAEAMSGMYIIEDSGETYIFFDD